MGHDPAPRRRNPARPRPGRTRLAPRPRLELTARGIARAPLVIRPKGTPLSCNRENVIWESADGTWNIGFWRFDYAHHDDDEEFDPEWSVEYFDDAFWFCSTGHPTWEAALDDYLDEEPNPGGTTIVRQSDPGNAKDIANYERLAAEFRAEHGSSRSTACP
ncbi:hypothetical protein ACWD3I_25040 [Streptomyces sp. NPDC002817]|uniref:hypothetical protein n=1 Tax=Streptomyces sp. NPDC088357 TaxID=3154655 RepID=UPI0034211822